MISNAINQPDEPFTLDKLRKLQLTMPKRELWLSTMKHPGPDAMIIEGGSEKFVVANPFFWARVQDYCRKEEAARKAGLAASMLPTLYSGIPIIEIDAHPDDSTERTIYIADIWAKLEEAARVAMVKLPEWLRPAPKFGEHG